MVTNGRVWQSGIQYSSIEKLLWKMGREEFRGV